MRKQCILVCIIMLFYSVKEEDITRSVSPWLLIVYRLCKNIPSIFEFFCLNSVLLWIFNTLALLHRGHHLKGMLFATHWWVITNNPVITHWRNHHYLVNSSVKMIYNSSKKVKGIPLIIQNVCARFWSLLTGRVNKLLCGPETHPGH